MKMLMADQPLVPDMPPQPKPKPKPDEDKPKPEELPGG